MPYRGSMRCSGWKRRPPTTAKRHPRPIGMEDSTQADIAGVRETIETYLRGHATGDPAYMRRAFLPTAHIEGIRDGAFTSWGLDEYCALFNGQPAPDEATRQ